VADALSEECVSVKTFLAAMQTERLSDVDSRAAIRLHFEAAIRLGHQTQFRQNRLTVFDAAVTLARRREW
jgi:hypothetical protein